jgi:hypothetical protein
MDIKLFEQLGKIAGLAGVSVGLLLLIFQAVIKKLNFPKLNTSQATRIIREILYITAFIAVMGIAAWVYSNRKITSLTITGHVMEMDSKKPLSGAKVIVGGRNAGTQTDGDGNFKISFLGDDQPTSAVHVFVSKQGYAEKDKDVELGQYIEVSLTPEAPSPTVAKSTTPPPIEYEVDSKPEVYRSDVTASGSCKDQGAWASVCTPVKPDGWTISYQAFELEGDRRCGAWANCGPKDPITATRACYQFQTQGHDEECGHSGNTGIHYSTGVLTVLWKHPKATASVSPASAAPLIP